MREKEPKISAKMIELVKGQVLSGLLSKQAKDLVEKYLEFSEFLSNVSSETIDEIKKAAEDKLRDVQAHIGYSILYTHPGQSLPRPKPKDEADLVVDMMKPISPEDYKKELMGISQEEYENEMTRQAMLRRTELLNEKQKSDDDFVKSFYAKSPSAIYNTFKKRDSKIMYYLGIAEAVLAKGTCLRRKFGAIIVKDDVIVSTGYVGAPRGRANCNDLGTCTREKLNIPKGQRYELCRSVHAEANAIIHASREEMLGASLYLCCHNAKTNELDGNVEPCSMCKRMIINSGIVDVFVKTSVNTYKRFEVKDWVDNDDSLELKEGY